MRCDMTRQDLWYAAKGLLPPTLFAALYLSDQMERAIVVGLWGAAYAFVNGAVWSMRRALPRLDHDAIQQDVNAALSAMFNRMLADGVVVPGPNFPRVGESYTPTGGPVQ